jgi:glucokinase
MPVIGLDLGGTKLSGAVFNENGNILIREYAEIGERKGEDVGELIKQTIVKLIKSGKEQNIEIKSIGVSVPGISYSKIGTVWAPNIPGWENYPLLDELKTVSGNSKIKIDSDRACYILGELWRGNAQGCKDAIFIAVGTGIGAGILINGEVLRGANDIAGAIGWLALDRPFLGKYKICGCFEYHASGEGIGKIAREYLETFDSYNGMLREKEIPSVTSHDIFEAYRKKDPLAEKVINEAIEYWGMAVANLVSIFNPEKIIFGGGVFGPALELLDKIYAEAVRWAQPISIKQVKLEGSKLGGDAGLFGAGYLALRNAGVVE